MRIIIDVDYNGIVFFDPQTVKCVDSEVKEGVNLLERYTNLDVGDDVLQKGAFVPILAIDAGTYTLCIESDGQSEPHGGKVIVENSYYALRVTEKAYVADLDVLMRWREDPTGWLELNLEPGDYMVSIEGFRESNSSELLDAGYKIIFSKEKTLPVVTADTGKNMRVNYPFNDTPLS